MLKVKSGNDFALLVLKVYKTHFGCRPKLQDLHPLTLTAQGQGTLFPELRMATVTESSPRLGSFQVQPSKQ